MHTQTILTNAGNMEVLFICILQYIIGEETTLWGQYLTSMKSHTQTHSIVFDMPTLPPTKAWTIPERGKWLSPVEVQYSMGKSVCVLGWVGVSLLELGEGISFEISYLNYYKTHLLKDSCSCYQVLFCLMFQTFQESYHKLCKHLTALGKKYI